jgi:NACalpha-BTF3-like transcription factor
MSKLPLDEKQLAFIMDCLENRKMSLAQVAEQIGVTSSIFYKKVAGIPEIQQYKKKQLILKKKKNIKDSMLKSKVLYEDDGKKSLKEYEKEETYTGRQPRRITEEDMELLEDLVYKGLPMKLVAKELAIPLSTLYQYMERNPIFAESLRRGKVRHARLCEEKVQSGEMDKGLFTYFSKTKWKDIFPQEERFIPALPPLSLQGSLDLKQTILPGRRDSQEETEEE